MTVNHHAAKLADIYKSADLQAAPTSAQWSRLLSQPVSEPVTLVNLFKLRARAQYKDDAYSGSGEEAFQRYAAVSVPAVARAGGDFLLVGSFLGSFVGADEDWDVVAIGRYPDIDALVALHEDKAYQDCFHHRIAACERQRVFACR